jgi:hypothetical protein
LGGGVVYLKNVGIDLKGEKTTLRLLDAKARTYLKRTQPKFDEHEPFALSVYFSPTDLRNYVTLRYFGVFGRPFWGVHFDATGAVSSCDTGVSLD